jgi:hypothetical protein
MRKVIGCIVLLILVLGAAKVVISADAEKREKPSCLFHNDAIKDAKYEVTNIADGATIKITSDKPEVVKQIQELVSKCQEVHKSGDHKMCPMKDKSNPSCHHEQQEEKKK